MTLAEFLTKHGNKYEWVPGTPKYTLSTPGWIAPGWCGLSILSLKHEGGNLVVLTTVEDNYITIDYSFWGTRSIVTEKLSYKLIQIIKHIIGVFR